MKTLLVYYTRTGTTKKLAQALADKIGCEPEELIDETNRDGIIGWLKSGFHAGRKKLTKIKQPQKNPADYELIIIGTPVWVGTMSAAIRTYLTQYRDKINRLAFFTTQGSDKRQKVFNDMAELAGKKPAAEFFLAAKEVKAGGFEGKVDQFINSLQ